MNLNEYREPVRNGRANVASRLKKSKLPQRLALSCQFCQSLTVTAGGRNSGVRNSQGWVKRDERRGFFCIPQDFRFEGIANYVLRSPGFQTDYRVAIPVHFAQFHSPRVDSIVWTGDEILLA
jgi:hypothetical protein